MGALSRAPCMLRSWDPQSSSPLCVSANLHRHAAPLPALWLGATEQGAPQNSRSETGKRRRGALLVLAAGGRSSGSGSEEDWRRLQEGMRERRAVDQSETLMEHPYDPVESAMSSPVVTTTPETPVGSLLEQLEHFTGLPVVDAAGKCVGIVSSIDIFRHQRQASPSITDACVRDVMTSPAVVIARHAPIAYAAGLMLKHKVHRLPVVDSDNVVVGIVTRTDLYEPLMPQVNPLFHRLAGELSPAEEHMREL